MKPLLYSVLPRPPHPSRDGLAIRNYYLLEALARRFEVRAFSLLDPQRSYGGVVPIGLEIEYVPQRPRGARRPAAVLSSIASGDPYSAILYRSRRLERRLAEESTARHPVWVVAHSYHVAPAAATAAAPLWIDFHNVDSRIWARMGETASSGGRRAFARAQAPRVERLERKLVRRADGLSCVSRGDAAGLAAIGAAAEPLVTPNGVDLSRYAFRAAPAAGEMILFVGDLSWPPNAEGVRWFAERAWPFVREKRPNARVEVLGRGAAPELRRLGGDRLVFLGAGDDTRPHWARASVAIVPLSAGGGTRLKILEAAACGVPVVSTAVGAEGLEFPPAEVCVADEPEAFAEAVVAVLADREASRRQAAAARARVEVAYGWDRIAARFADELLRRAEDRR